jgi:uncharacterized membrane protein
MEEEEGKGRGGMMRTLRTYFITGLVTLLPLLITVIILVYVFQRLDALLTRLVPLFVPSLISPLLMERAGGLIAVGVKIASLLIIVGVITLFGFFASQVMGRRILDFAERRVFFHIPLISTIYRTIKEINDVLFTGKKYIFKRVVMIEYPRPGIYSIGFVTAETPMAQEGGESSEKMLSVFIPTTPNPTSGYLALIPEKNTTPLPIRIERAFKLVISGGALATQYKDELKESRKSLEDHRNPPGSVLESPHG